MKLALKITIGVLLLALIPLYYFIDPATAVWMPKCPFKLLTTLDCPACGNQRTLHQLLHGNWLEALNTNPFIVISILYLGAVIITSYGKGKIMNRCRAIVQGRVVAIIYVILFFAWWILRNTPLIR